MAPLIESTAKPEQLASLLEMEIKILEEEHHAPMHALQKVADALPGFGIVAAVLGIVITMGHIDGPPAEIGHKVGAALVGTFLGILASYGFAAPLANSKLAANPPTTPKPTNTFEKPTTNSARAISIRPTKHWNGCSYSPRSRSRNRILAATNRNGPMTTRLNGTSCSPISGGRLAF